VKVDRGGVQHSEVRCEPGTPSAAQKEQFLETSPITKNLTAVKNRCFLPLSYDEVTPSPRNAEAIVAIAHWLHPTAFGLPADGS
jgi:iron complex transport system substrate-binding protein